MQWQSIVVVAVQSTQPQLIRQLNLSAIETIVIDFELIGELEDGMQLEIYRFEESSGLALFTHTRTHTDTNTAGVLSAVRVEFSNVPSCIEVNGDAVSTAESLFVIVSQSSDGVCGSGRLLQSVLMWWD